MIDPKQFAESTLQLLQVDPRNYRNFGVYWYFVKAILKLYYDQNNLYMLGNYRDPDVVARMPKHENVQEVLQAAVDTYRSAAAYGMGTNQFVDPEGETFILNDPDAGM